MAKAEATVEELVSKIERGELRLPEMQRRYVWRSSRVRDLLDSLYRGYPSGAILIWETDERVPQQDFAITQESNPYAKTQLLLDGQQRLTSLSAVIRGQPVQVNGRVRPIELLFNLEHPDALSFVTEVDDNNIDAPEFSDDGEEPIDEEADATEDELQKRFDKMTFVVGTRKLEQLPQWVKVSEVFKLDNDAPFLQRAGVSGFDDPRYERYSQRLARLRGIRKYVYRMDVLERTLSYDEVTEIFVRVNSLGAKLRSSDLALAQITAKWRGSLKVFQAFQADCTNDGFEVDLGLHLKNLVAHATGQSRFLTVANLTLEELKAGWDDGCRGMEFAINFLRSNAGITSPALLASPFLLISLGFYGAQRSYKLAACRSAGPTPLGVARQCQGPLQPGLQRNPARPRPQNPSRWRGVPGAARSAAHPGGPAGCHPRRARRPQPTQCPVQDDVPGLSSSRCTRLAFQSGHRPQPCGQCPPAAVPPHLPQGCSQEQLPAAAKQTTSPTSPSSAARPTARSVPRNLPSTSLRCEKPMASSPS